MTDDRRRWWNFIGPWPFRPVLLFVAACLFYNITAVGAMTAGSTLNLRNFVFTGFLEAVISSIPILVIMVAGRSWQRSHGVRWGSYLTFIVVAAVGALTLRYLLVIREAFADDILVPMLVATSRVFLFLFVVLGLAGAVTERLERQVAATEKALEQSRRQQEQILQADEDARRQVADLLHDRVQAGLIAACLELQVLPGDESQRDQAIAGIIHRLETLRGIDVKRAARSLSPSLQDVDLHAALRELGAQYEPSMVTNVDVAPEVEQRITSPEMRLGLYRITEQALMNAAIHGRARHVDVSIRVSNEPSIEWEVRDDGAGIDPDAGGTGLGSALMTTWMRRLDGRWSLSPREGGGAVCRATMSLS